MWIADASLRIPTLASGCGGQYLYSEYINLTHGPRYVFV